MRAIIFLDFFFPNSEMYGSNIKAMSASDFFVPNPLIDDPVRCNNPSEMKTNQIRSNKVARTSNELKLREKQLVIIYIQE